MNILEKLALSKRDKTWKWTGTFRKTVQCISVLVFGTNLFASISLDIPEEAIKDKSAQSLLDQASFPTLVDGSMTEFFSYRYGRRIEAQDLDNSCLQEEYDAYQEEFKQWCHNRYGFEQIPIGNKKKLESEFRKFLKKQEESIPREEIPTIKIQNCFYEKEGATKHVEEEKLILQELEVLLCSYPLNERIEVEKQWDDLEDTWPRFAQRVFQMGIFFERNGKIEKASELYNISSKYQNSVNNYLRLNLLTLKDNINPALRLFWMFFKAYQSTVQKEKKPTSLALSYLARTIESAETTKKEASVFRKTVTTIPMFFPEDTLVSLKTKRDMFVFWHLSDSCKNRCISADPTVQSHFACCLILYFQNEFPLKDWHHHIQDLLNNPMYCLSYDLGKRTNNAGRLYSQKTFVLKKSLKLSNSSKHYIQIRVKYFEDNGEYQMTFGILKNAPIDSAGELVGSMLCDEHNEILKIGFLHGSLFNQDEIMPIVTPARIQTPDLANPYVFVDCKGDFSKGTAEGIMSNKGCADVHIIPSKINFGKLSASNYSKNALYANGAGLPSQDKNKNVHILLKDANNNNVDAQFKLAELYRTGQNNVQRDESCALYWYSKVAKSKQMSKQAQINTATKWMNIIKSRKRLLDKEERMKAIKALPLVRDAFEEGIIPLFNGVENFDVLKKAVERMTAFYKSDSCSEEDKKWLCSSLKNYFQKAGIATCEIIVDGFYSFYEGAKNWEDKENILEILQELCNHKTIYIHKTAFRGLCRIATMASNDGYRWFDDTHFSKILTPLLNRFPTYQNEHIRRVKVEEKIVRYRDSNTNKWEEKELCRDIYDLLNANDRDYSPDRVYAVECFNVIKLSDAKKRRLFGSVLHPLLGHYQSEVRLTASLILRTFFAINSTSFDIIPGGKNVIDVLQIYLTVQNEYLRWGAAQSLSLLYNDGFLKEEIVKDFVSSPDKKLRDIGIWLTLENDETSVADILTLYTSLPTLSKKRQSVLAQKIADLCEDSDDAKRNLLALIISNCEMSKNPKRIIKYLGLIYDLYTRNDRKSFMDEIFFFFNKADMSEWAVKCFCELYKREEDLDTRTANIKRLKLFESNNLDIPSSTHAANALKEILQIQGLWFHDRRLIEHS